MSERVLRFFSSPVIVAEVPDAPALCAELERKILEKAEADAGVVRTNVGGWHSNIDLFQWIGSTGETLLRHVLDLATGHTGVLGSAEQQVRWQVQAWANVNRAGDSNSPHFHAGVFWSAVFYVRVDDGPGGNLVFHDPRMPALRMHAPTLLLRDGGPEGMAKIKPRTGQLIMFPAWLQHSVEPFEGEQPRISIAFNVMAAQQLVGPKGVRKGAGVARPQPANAGQAGDV